MVSIFCSAYDVTLYFYFFVHTHTYIIQSLQMAFVPRPDGGVYTGLGTSGYILRN